eukprot:TRINITY_DN18123_c0_g1_i1.p1 TRINITY_DN18123_c0_g1~~TRINITY_DN18123_c0_g1_i1.p1  ORF type:complete len:857 (-),score=169.29 TRINITY_DN18123_c0_g1_i1:225-2795(-)
MSVIIDDEADDGPLPKRLRCATPPVFANDDEGDSPLPTRRRRMRRARLPGDSDDEPLVRPAQTAPESATEDSTFPQNWTSRREQLVSMGFEAQAAMAALLAAEGDVLRASEALAEASTDAVPGGISQILQGLPQLVSMGFSKEVATAALADASGDVGRAANFLAEQMDLSGESQTNLGQKSASVRPTVPHHGEVPEKVSASAAAPSKQIRRNDVTPLTALSAKAKQAVIAALGGPDGVRSNQVNLSIKRGRVAQHKHAWPADDPSEVQLEKWSPAYAKLKSYQRVGVRWLLGLSKNGLGGILADEMGLGKTAQALAFLDMLPNVAGKTAGQPIRPSLVVVPSSLMSNWEKECTLWCPHFHPFRYHGDQTERTQLAEDFFTNHYGKSWIILTTSGVLRNKDDRAGFFGRIQFECLVIDEAHSMRNSGTQCFRDVQRGIRAERRLLLTGTPVHNSLKELGTLLTLLIQVHGCKNRSTNKVIQELDEIVERGALRTLQVRAAPLMLRRLKRDVMSDLPAKEGNLVRCSMTSWQQQIYDQEMTKCKSQAKTGELKTAKSRKEFVKSAFARLRRLCNHPLLTQGRLTDADYVSLAEVLRGVRPDFAKATMQKCLEFVRSWSDFEVAGIVREYNIMSRLSQYVDRSKLEISKELLTGSGKVRELLSLLQQQQVAGRKTLVFSQFTQFLDIIGEALRMSGLSFLRLDGNSRIEDRQSIVDRFQDESSSLQIMLVSLKAGGTGLNLTAADKVVLMDLSFNPQDNRQAEDRAHRLGQTRPVSVHYMVTSNTIEEVVVKSNAHKMALDYKFGGQKSTLQGGFSDLSALADEDGAVSSEDEAEAESKTSKEAEQAAVQELEKELGFS